MQYTTNSCRMHRTTTRPVEAVPALTEGGARRPPLGVATLRAATAGSPNGELPSLSPVAAPAANLQQIPSVLVEEVSDAAAAFGSCRLSVAIVGIVINRWRPRHRLRHNPSTNHHHRLMSKSTPDIVAA
jgi:hypothetical protein